MKNYTDFFNESVKDPMGMIQDFYNYVLLKKWKIVSNIEKPTRARNVLFKFEYLSEKSRVVEVTYNKFYKSIVVKTDYTNIKTDDYTYLDTVDKFYDLLSPRGFINKESKEKTKPTTPIKEKSKSRLPNWRENGFFHMWVDSDGDMWIKHDMVDRNFIQLKDWSDVDYSHTEWDGHNNLKLLQFFNANKINT